MWKKWRHQLKFAFGVRTNQYTSLSSKFHVFFVERCGHQLKGNMSKIKFNSGAGETCELTDSQVLTFLKADRQSKQALIGSWAEPWRSYHDYIILSDNPSLDGITGLFKDGATSTPIADWDALIPEDWMDQFKINPGK